MTLNRRKFIGATAAVATVLSARMVKADGHGKPRVVVVGGGAGGATAARYLAKNVVAAKLAEKCTIQLSYAIGVAQPLSIYVDTHGTGKVHETVLEDAIRANMDLSPTGIRKHLDLNRPIYARTAAYGHFGREPSADGGFSWERTDLVDTLKKLV